MSLDGSAAHLADEFERLLERLASVASERDAEKEKNELLRFQLRQVQHELNKACLGYLTTNNSNDEIRIYVPARKRPEKKKSGTGTTVDMRCAINGENWFEAGSEGRWAGPALRSTLRLPPLASGSYRLKLRILSAVSSEILRGMRATIDGKEVQLKSRSSREVSGKGWKRIYNNYLKREIVWPMIATSKFEIEAIGVAHHSAELALEFPETIALSELGSQDQRPRAIHLQQIDILRC